MPNSYSELLSPLPQIAETASPYLFMTERHLHAMWLEQKYFRNLTTSEGENIEVICPGIWNNDAGPDFLKAHIRIGCQEYKGDIEIHLNAEDWKHHGHHLDSRYNNVILHVALWQPRHEQIIDTSEARHVAQTSLEYSLTISQARIVQLIDLDLYPYKRFLGSGRCAQNLFRKIPSNAIVSFFSSAAEWRLKQKSLYLRTHIEEPGLYLGGGIAMALGYKRNSKAFLDLFLYLYEHRAIGEEALFALALKECGFFEEVYRSRWGGSELYTHLKTLSMMLSFSYRMPIGIKLELNKIRPLNHPVRRLMVMVKIIQDDSMPFLFENLNHAWALSWQKADWLALRKKFMDLLPSYKDPYWNSHYAFEASAQEEFLPMMGNQIKKEIIINTALPLLYENIASKAVVEEINAFRDFYRSFSASYTGKTRYLIHRFFGDGPKSELIQSADIEQGAYQLHRDFCLHFEASCEGCPFISRYLEINKRVLVAANIRKPYTF